MLEKFLQLKDRVFDNPLIFNLKSPFDGREKNLKLFRSYLKVKKNEKVLDIACGTGNFSKVTDGDYVGIDLNKKFVDYPKFPDLEVSADKLDLVFNWPYVSPSIHIVKKLYNFSIGWGKVNHKQPFLCNSAGFT